MKLTYTMTSTRIIFCAVECPSRSLEFPITSIGSDRFMPMGTRAECSELALLLTEAGADVEDVPACECGMWVLIPVADVVTALNDAGVRHVPIDFEVLLEQCVEKLTEANNVIYDEVGRSDSATRVTEMISSVIDDLNFELKEMRNHD